jgi:hypothetical protein
MTAIDPQISTRVINRRWMTSPPTPFAVRSRGYIVVGRAGERDAVVVELPMYSSGAIFHNARYMLKSTAHWNPLLNGYSGCVPASFAAHREILSTYPSASSVAALRERGVTHLVVHRQEILAPLLRRLRAALTFT